MLLLVYKTWSGLEVRNCVGRWLSVLAEEEVREEGWVFQDTLGERNMVTYIDERFKRDMRKTKESIETDILEGFDIE